jgi:hypothetical protein
MAQPVSRATATLFSQPPNPVIATLVVAGPRTSLIYTRSSPRSVSVAVSRCGRVLVDGVTDLVAQLSGDRLSGDGAAAPPGRRATSCPGATYWLSCPGLRGQGPEGRSVPPGLAGPVRDHDVPATGRQPRSGIHPGPGRGLPSRSRAGATSRRCMWHRPSAVSSGTGRTSSNFRVGHSIRSAQAARSDSCASDPGTAVRVGPTAPPRPRGRPAARPGRPARSRGAGRARHSVLPAPAQAPRGRAPRPHEP